MRNSQLLGLLSPEPPDGLLALIGLYAADKRACKIDVGVGVYRDANGRTPVFAAVKAAEQMLVAEQASKSYLGPAGDEQYVELLASEALGSDLASSPSLVGMQTPGGTGALRLGAELINRASPGQGIWIGTPTWANHIPIFSGVGLTTRQYRFFNSTISDFDIEAMLVDLAQANAGDILLLHGCCHNPTGTSFNIEQWSILADLVVERGLLPFIDVAYHGLGLGLDQDVSGMRLFLARVPSALIAYSCDKNFGLYRERVGALWIQTNSPTQAEIVRSNAHALARINWSMPPDHGAAIVRTILGDASLRREWEIELTAMKDRISTLRAALAGAHPRLAPIGRQHGLFAMLPLCSDAVAKLREQHAIYMAGNGRINIAGLQMEMVPALAAAILPYLDSRLSDFEVL